MTDNTNYMSVIAETIIKAADLGGLPEADMARFRLDLEAQAARRLGLIIIENLDEQRAEEYMALAQKEELDPAELEAFFKKNLPDYEAKVEKGMEEFIQEAVEAATK